jgi:hypothetical protein
MAYLYKQLKHSCQNCNTQQTSIIPAGTPEISQTSFTAAMDPSEIYLQIASKVKIKNKRS